MLQIFKCSIYFIRIQYIIKSIHLNYLYDTVRFQSIIQKIVFALQSYQQKRYFFQVVCISFLDRAFEHGANQIILQMIDVLILTLTFSILDTTFDRYAKFVYREYVIYCEMSYLEKKSKSYNLAVTQFRFANHYIQQAQMEHS